jgi:hypothetical protein
VRQTQSINVTSVLEWQCFRGVGGQVVNVDFVTNRTQKELVRLVVHVGRTRLAAEHQVASREYHSAEVRKLYNVRIGVSLTWY